MPNENKFVSLAKQIRKVITFRIAMCLFLLSATVVSLSLYDGYNSFSLLQKHVKAQCDEIKNYAISQLLINNEAAIQAQLDEINEKQISTHFTWIKSDNYQLTEKIKWIFPGRWSYSYPILSSDNTKLGYLIVHGSFISDKALFDQFIIRMILLLIFSISMFSLLYPMAIKIPRLLFVEPINELLKLIGNKEGKNNLNQFHSTSSEINEISEKIKYLFQKNEKNTRELAFSQMAKQVAHDIRSPLSALDVIIKDLIKIPEEQRILIRNAINRIHDIANNLLNKHNIKSPIDDEAESNDAPELISDLVSSVISEKRAQFKNIEIEFTTNIHESAYGCFANISIADFKRVLSNLLNNSIESLADKKKGLIKIELSTRKSHLIFSIQDNGCGIAADILPKIISGEIITRKKNGHGLGLSYAIQMIEDRWRGQLAIQSCINEGTKIEIILPQAS
ncbi:MAG: HAMP domain-containing histidine kinase, partial [Gammaproteobacteria bacterium]|nr:HAMP domain-containing histidine kinase [Gammaproteobacteria bacterium]